MTPKEEFLHDEFKKFATLYRSKVELTGKKIRRIDPFNLPMNPSHPITYTEVDEIAIKMPIDEYEKFMNSWRNYIDLMYVAKHNPMIGEEYHKLLTLVQLLK